MTIEELYDQLGVDNAPGQESLNKEKELTLLGPVIEGPLVDFSHGDVNAHRPTPGSFELFETGFYEGAAQAYTPYRGRKQIMEGLAERLSAFTGVKIDGTKNLILTPGTQGALFLAMGANVMPGDKVAIVEPDYFANRKMVTFFHAELVPIKMDYTHTENGSGIDLDALEAAFCSGVKVFLFSNPNNPVGCIYSFEEISRIAKLAKEYGVTVIADELYSRQVYENKLYTHFCAQKELPENLITIIGPSKTESLSGYRLGVAFGSEVIIDRMEKLQAIMSLRCGGYNQAVFNCWFSEPEGWLAERVKEHQRIRDDIMTIIHQTPGISARPTEGGSYLFVRIPELKVSLHEFIAVVRKLANVIVTPGTEFGPQFLHEFRINFSQDHDKAVAAMERLFNVMEWYRK